MKVPIYPGRRRRGARKPTAAEVLSISFLEFQQPLGMFVLAVNFLESRLSDAMYLLYYSPKISQIYITLDHIKSFAARIDLFSQMCYSRFGDKKTRARIDRLVKRLEAVNTRRNHLIHGRWQAPGPGVEAMVFRHLLQNKQIKEQWVRQVEPKIIVRDALGVYAVGHAVSRFSGLVQEQNARELRRASRGKS